MRLLQRWRYRVCRRRTGGVTTWCSPLLFLFGLALIYTSFGGSRRRSTSHHNVLLVTSRSLDLDDVRPLDPDFHHLKSLRVRGEDTFSSHFQVGFRYSAANNTNNNNNVGAARVVLDKEVETDRSHHHPPYLDDTSQVKSPGFYGNSNGGRPPGYHSNDNAGVTDSHHDIQDQFFSPRSQPQVSLGAFPYAHEARSTCDSGRLPVDLLVLVPSPPHHRMQRQAVRDTWGSLAYGRAWPGLHHKHGDHRSDTEELVRLVFLLGEDGSEDRLSLQRDVEEESSEYGDVVQWEGLVDTYFNLTMKVLLGLRWVTQFCPKAAYVAKADEDTFVHLPRLLGRLRSLREYSEARDSTILGPYFPMSGCMRTGRYAVSKEAYPFHMYPPHVKGNLYVLPGGATLSRMVNIAAYFPYNNMEDVHVTGTLARALGKRHESFTREEFSVVCLGEDLDACVFAGKGGVGVVGSQCVSPRQAYSIWKTFSDRGLCLEASRLTI